MKVSIIGGGLAGSEAAYQLLKRGYEVDMYEMRGVKNTPCHKTQSLAELVCSNSLKSFAKDTASGLLKIELNKLDCMLLKVAERVKVPAGGALAVDRELFSQEVEKELLKFEKFKVIRKEITHIDLDKPLIIASGPLTSDALYEEIERIIGKKDLHFYDALAPIISFDSIDMNKAFFAARYGKGDEDYLNLAMNKEEYLTFYKELVNAERVKLHDFEVNVFESCMPIEIMAERGEDTMRYGPLRPVGIKNPHKEERPYAVVQLRKENIEGNAYNVVGFQTNLKFPEQKRILSLIPGLENVEILRYGIMHRNTYINAPKVLNEYFQMKEYKNVFFAGQLTGVEGYVESIASGLIAAINLVNTLEDKKMMLLPKETIIGALQRHVALDVDKYEPMNANFGILPELENKSRDKKERKMQYTQRAEMLLDEYLKEGE